MNRLVMYRATLTLGALCLVFLFVLGSIGMHAHNPDAPGLGPFGYLAWYFVGAFAFWRRPHHPVARLLMMTGVVFTVEATIGYTLFQFVHRYGEFRLEWIVNAVQQGIEWEAYVAWVALLTIFPDGTGQQLYERRTLWTLVAFGAVLPTLLLLSHPLVQANEWFGRTPVPPSPAYVSALSPFGQVSSWLWGTRFTLILVGVGMLLFRVKRYSGQRLLQMQWALLASVFYVALNFVPFNQAGRVIGPNSGALGFIPWEIGFALMPFALSVAILKHRLLDIELVLRRSIIFGMLWIGIALVYVALAALFGIVAGQRFPLVFAILVTIAVTMVTGTARRWLEQMADRWVFGERLDRYELLRRFGTTLEEAFDLEQLASRVAAIIRQGLDVRWVRISLYRENMTLHPVGVDGTDGGAHVPAGATAPLLHGAELVGKIECGPKVDGRFDTRDQDLLETLGRQAALAIRNARLATELASRLEENQFQAEELAASRTRIVHAEEVERRRIERNIHDGVQQEIVALMAKVGLARNQLRRGSGTPDITLAEVQRDARQALEDLRELARGIHPPILSDRGLVEAIEALASRLPITVFIESDEWVRVRRCSEEIEGAAYFLICEALANVLKHASARHATVRLEFKDYKLWAEVSDDGQGFTSNGTAGSGLRGLMDRIEALGGSLQITSQPGQGTRLVANLPARERTHV